jgi:hypothetical protein
MDWTWLYIAAFHIIVTYGFINYEFLRNKRSSAEIDHWKWVSACGYTFGWAIADLIFRRTSQAATLFVIFIAVYCIYITGKEYSKLLVHEAE